MTRPLLHALVGASRFGLLLGLSLWLGLATALCVQLPLLGRRSPLAPPAALVTPLVRRVEVLLFVAMVLVIAGLGARVVLDRAAPPTTLLVPVAGMTIARLLGGLVVSPSLRALRARLGDGAPASTEAAAAVSSPGAAAATAAERSAAGRLGSARLLLLTLEVCLALYALFAIA